MVLGVNTNVSSMTAQRALTAADKMLGTSMERLSTGQRINGAGDDAAGLAVAERMTAQINSLNQAVKNANAGISLAQTIDGALVEVADMLQRAKELSVQASNSTVSAAERGFLQDEVVQLMAEIDRVASATTFNGVKVLDGTFSNQTLQLGGSTSETLSFSVESAASSALGTHQVKGDIIKEQTSGGGRNNITDDADDLVITGNGVTQTIGVSGADSAKVVAAAINGYEGTTGVSAQAQTQALVYTEKAAAATHSLVINGTATGSFSMSSTDVSGAITAINAISASTGVVASATSDYKIQLVDADGDDIRVENAQASQTDLKVKAQGFDGSNEMTKKAVHAVKNMDSEFANNTSFVIVNNTTGVNTTFTTATTQDQVAYETLINTALGATVGVEGRRESTDDVSALAAGNYYLKHNPTGDVFKLAVSAATVTGWNAAITNATYANGSFKDEAATSLTSRITATGGGTTITSQKLLLIGDKVFGDFDIFSDEALTTNIANTSAANHKVGVEATGIQVVQQDEAVTLDAAAAGAMASAVEIVATGTNLATNTNHTVIASAATAAAASGQKVALVLTEAGNDTTTLTAGLSMMVTGTDRNGNSLVEIVTLDAAEAHANGATELALVTTQDFKTVTKLGIDLGSHSASTDTFSVGFIDKHTNDGAEHDFTGARTFGDFDITNTSGTSQIASGTTGQTDSSATALGAADASTDTVTFQGGIVLSSNETFTVTQSGTEAGTAATNDNYFTTANSTISAASSVSLSTQAGAQSAMSVLDGAIEKVSSVRSGLGALENRLNHTVSNLMNVSESTSAARAVLVDADYSIESANLAKAQVLMQAGTAMLAQANASPQMVLQLLQ